MMITWWLPLMLVGGACAFWDEGTTTEDERDLDLYPRTSFFRWLSEEKFSDTLAGFRNRTTKNWRRVGDCQVGISIELTPIGPGSMLNRRNVLTSANILEPYLDRFRDLTVWTLGGLQSSKSYTTSVRYRIWRIFRIRPRSLSPEHQHGARGGHSPRHDLSIIQTKDQMLDFHGAPQGAPQPQRCVLMKKHEALYQILLAWGTGFYTMRHIQENYKMFFYQMERDNDVVDCSVFLPKWWGKFICLRNNHGVAGVSTGGGLFTGQRGGEAEVFKLVGIACFEIRYNDDRVLVFTDLRYYIDHIVLLSNYTPGDYYEYAYPERTNPKANDENKLMSDNVGVLKRFRYPLGRK